MRPPPIQKIDYGTENVPIPPGRRKRGGIPPPIQKTDYGTENVPIPPGRRGGISVPPSRKREGITETRKNKNLPNCMRIY